MQVLWYLAMKHHEAWNLSRNAAATLIIGGIAIGAYSYKAEVPGAKREPNVCGTATVATEGQIVQPLQEIAVEKFILSVHKFNLSDPQRLENAVAVAVDRETYSDRPEVPPADEINVGDTYTVCFDNQDFSNISITHTKAV